MLLLLLCPALGHVLPGLLLEAVAAGTGSVSDSQKVSTYRADSGMVADKHAGWWWQKCSEWWRWQQHSGTWMVCSSNQTHTTLTTSQHSCHAINQPTSSASISSAPLDRSSTLSMPPQRSSTA